MYQDRDNIQVYSYSSWVEHRENYLEANNLHKYFEYFMVKFKYNCNTEQKPIWIRAVSQSLFSRAELEYSAQPRKSHQAWIELNVFKYSLTYEI